MWWQHRHREFIFSRTTSQPPQCFVIKLGQQEPAQRVPDGLMAVSNIAVDECGTPSCLFAAIHTHKLSVVSLRKGVLMSTTSSVMLLPEGDESQWAFADPLRRMAYAIAEPVVPGTGDCGVSEPPPTVVALHRPRHTAVCVDLEAGVVVNEYHALPKESLVMSSLLQCGWSICHADINRFAVGSTNGLVSLFDSRSGRSPVLQTQLLGQHAASVSVRQKKRRREIFGDDGLVGPPVRGPCVTSIVTSGAAGGHLLLCGTADSAVSLLDVRKTKSPGGRSSSSVVWSASCDDSAHTPTILQRVGGWGRDELSAPSGSHFVVSTASGGAMLPMTMQELDRWGSSGGVRLHANKDSFGSLALLLHPSGAIPESHSHDLNDIALCTSRTSLALLVPSKICDSTISVFACDLGSASLRSWTRSTVVPINERGACLNDMSAGRWVRHIRVGSRWSLLVSSTGAQYVVGV